MTSPGHTDAAASSGTAEQHEAAWRIPSGEGGNDEYGVLVRCGSDDGLHYWWLLCPGTATLYINDGDDLRECNDVGCVWDDVHAEADRLQKRLIQRHHEAAASRGAERSAQ